MNLKLNKTKAILLTITFLVIIGLYSFKKPLLNAFNGINNELEIQNDTFSTAKYKGKVVILNFWASWSKTSRADNKNLVRIYQKYKTNPKITFASISLDTDEASWKTAIEEDELIWKEHFCDFKKYESSIIKNFKITTIPAVLVIDKTGSITLSASKIIDIETSIDALLK